MSDAPPRSEALQGEEGSGVRTFLIADVRGYTHFTQEHGDEAAAELTGAFANSTRTVAARCGGAVIELRGDEALVAFASARQALRAAVALQEAFAGRTGDAVALPLGVGIGIDAGEAVPLEQGYRGGALNLAARLCANARAGEVLASEGVMHLAGRVEGLEFRDPVRLRVKGLPQPIRAYQVVSEGSARAKRRRRPAEVASRRRWAGVAASGALLAAVAGVLIFVASRPSSAHALTRIDASSAGAIDPASNQLVNQVHVGAGPGRMAVGFGSLWVVNDLDSTVSRIDPSSGIVQRVISVHGDPTAIAVGAGFVWVACSATRSVDRIDPRVDRRVQSVGVGNGPSGIALSPGAVWVTNRLDDNVTEIDAKTGHVRRTHDAGPSPSDIAYGLGALWIANESSSTVTRLDPVAGGLEEIPVGNGPEAVAIGNGAVWVANSLDGTVSRIDPSRDAVAYVITVGSGPSSVLASDGAIWVADSYDSRVVRIDPATNLISRKIDVGSGPQSLASIGGRVWLSTRGTANVHRGGTLRVSDFVGIDSADAALNGAEVGWSVLSAVGDGLVAFKRVAGLDGDTLVPDLATAVPGATDGGRTYTFHLRRGIRYSNGVPVRASDLRRALERAFRMETGRGYFGGLIGARACSKSRCDLSRGVIANDGAGTVTLHLSEPDPVLMDNLTLPLAYPVPPGIPMAEPAPLGVPGTGPYVIRSFSPKQLVLVRNPRFREWSAAAQPDGYPDKIVLTYKNARSAQVTAVEHGKGDLMISPPSHRMDELETRYAAQIHVFLAPTTFGIFLNTRLPPFESPAARKAFNYAIDRSKAIPGFGGVGGATVTCQILPVGMPAYRPYCPYTRNSSAAGIWKGPDLARARKLVDASGTRGQKVVLWTGSKPFQLALGHLALDTLVQLGYRASLKIVSGEPPAYFGKIYDSRTRAQAGFIAWGADYPSASNFLAPQFSCATAPPASQGGINAAQLCSPRLDEAVRRALSGQITDKAASANARWAAIDRMVTDIAPWAPIVNGRSVVFVSRRVGNVQANQALGVLLDQIWVK